MGRGICTYLGCGLRAGFAEHWRRTGAHLGTEGGNQCSLGGAWFEENSVSMNTLLIFNIILKFKSIVDIISIILFSIISDLNLKLPEPDHFLLIPSSRPTVMTYKVSYIFVHQFL